MTVVRKEFETINGGRGLLVEKAGSDWYSGEDEMYNSSTFIFAHPFRRHDGSEDPNYHSGYYDRDTIVEMIEHLAECAGIEVTIGQPDELDVALRDL